MAAAPVSNPNLTNPKSMKRAKAWSDEVEEVYRFQLAGYRDRHDYAAKMGEIGVSAGPHRRPNYVDCPSEVYKHDLVYGNVYDEV